MRELVTFALRTCLVLLLLTACYYALPDDGPFESLQAGLRALCSLLALTTFVLLVRFRLRSVRRRPTVWGRSEALLTVLYLLILGFAIVYDVLARADAGQFVGIADRTDALYFTVTVISTVGFGDIHAAGTAARGLVTVQMLVNVFFLGAALRLLTGLGGRLGGGLLDELDDDPDPRGAVPRAEAEEDGR